MVKRGIDSIRSLIEDFLDDSDEVAFSHKKGHRTFTITRKELKEKVNRIKTLFEKHNIRKEDKIIILSSNYLEWISVYFAAILSGVVSVPLDTLTDNRLLHKIQKQTHAKAIFQDKKLAKAAIKTFYLDELDDVLKNIKLSERTETHEAESHPEDILEIMYTSGTTGEPKGVVLTNKNMTFGVNAAIRSVPLKARLKQLVALPLSHIFSQVYGLFFMMYMNNKVFFSDNVQPRKLISLIKYKMINGLVTVPGIVSALKKELEGKSVLSNLGIQFRLIGSGGASLDIEVEKWWKRHLITVLQGYGLTETSSVISVNKIGTSKTGSVGKIVDGVEVKIAEDGEILAKGENVFPGYYKNEDKTEEAFEDGWFRTGDIGEIRHGYLYIKDRKKDVIITGKGLKAYPIDIENVLDGMNGIKKSCVIEKDGKVHAVLILNRKTDASEIIKKANKRLLEHQKISGFSIWLEPDFPLTATGKVKKFIVKEDLEKIKGKEYKYENMLYSVIDRVLSPNKKIAGDSKLAELGMDSLKRVELIAELEKDFRVEIEETKLTQNTKVDDLEKIMKEKIVRKIKFRTWPMSLPVRILRKLSQKILWYPIIRIFTRTEYFGLHHLEDIKMPVIVATNHQSAWDPAIIAEKFPSKFAISAHPEIVFGIGVKNPFVRAWRRFYGFLSILFFNAYPFGEKIGTDKSLEFTGEMLDRGYSIGITPEGERTTDGQIHEFKPGVGYMAVNMNVPVIPARVEGMFHVLPRGRKIPRFGKSIVKFGKPIMPDEFKHRTYLEAAKYIEKKVREL
jgi:long-chain acyl-CoA synthetase